MSETSSLQQVYSLLKTSRDDMQEKESKLRILESQLALLKSKAEAQDALILEANREKSAALGAKAAAQALAQQRDQEIAALRKEILAHQAKVRQARESSVGAASQKRAHPAPAT